MLYPASVRRPLPSYPFRLTSPSEEQIREPDLHIPTKDVSLTIWKLRGADLK